MSHVLYVPGFVEPGDLPQRLLVETPWVQRTESRLECFMANGDPYPYTYGTGRGERTYYSIPTSDLVEELRLRVNAYLAAERPSWGPMTGCFLNRYDYERHHLGWHADNFKGMDHSKCVAVVSFGEEREFLYRENPTPGTPRPAETSLVLGNGSLLLMEPGMQHTHQHRLPKGRRANMKPRVSATFRAFF